MAIVQNPIVGRAIGKVANSVFTKWKGRNIWKSKAISVSNPQTDGQLKQRARFSILVRLSSIFLSVIRVGFREQAGSVTEVNAFNSVNQRNQFLVWDGTQWVQDLLQLEISKGSLDPTAVAASGVTNGSSSIVLTFANTASGNQSLGDKLSAVVMYGYNVIAKTEVVSRNVGTYSVALPNALATFDEVTILTFFSSADGKKASINTREQVAVS